jgi:hypothetical protein
MHLSVTKRGPFGGERVTSLCGRLHTLADGMNLTADPQEVTCKFCLRRLRPSGSDGHG